MICFGSLVQSGALARPEIWRRFLTRMNIARRRGNTNKNIAARKRNECGVKFLPIYMWRAWRSGHHCAAGKANFAQMSFVQSTASLTPSLHPSYRAPACCENAMAHGLYIVPSGDRRLKMIVRHFPHPSPRPSRFFRPPLPSHVASLQHRHDFNEQSQAQYRALSIIGGMGLISVPSSCSTLYRLKRSSYVIRLMANPRCPKRPLRPTRCR